MSNISRVAKKTKHGTESERVCPYSNNSAVTPFCCMMTFRTTDLTPSAPMIRSYTLDCIAPVWVLLPSSRGLLLLLLLPPPLLLRTAELVCEMTTPVMGSMLMQLVSNLMFSLHLDDEDLVCCWKW